MHRVHIPASQERCPRVLLEQIDPADIAAQRVELAVPADLGHLEHRRPALGRAGQEPAAQAVAAVGVDIQPDPARIPLHDAGGAVVHQGGV